MPDDVLRRIAGYRGSGGILRATSTGMRELVDASARSIHLRPHDGPSDLLARLGALDPPASSRRAFRPARPPRRPAGGQGGPVLRHRGTRRACQFAGIRPPRDPGPFGMHVARGPRSVVGLRRPEIPRPFSIRGPGPRPARRVHGPPDPEDGQSSPRPFRRPPVVPLGPEGPDPHELLQLLRHRPSRGHCLAEPEARRRLDRGHQPPGRLHRPEAPGDLRLSDQGPLSAGRRHEPSQHDHHELRRARGRRPHRPPRRPAE
jgi:hypothetical protein